MSRQRLASYMSYFSIIFFSYVMLDSLADFNRQLAVPGQSLGDVFPAVQIILLAGATVCMAELLYLIMSILISIATWKLPFYFSVSMMLAIAFSIPQCPLMSVAFLAVLIGNSPAIIVCWENRMSRR